MQYDNRHPLEKLNTLIFEEQQRQQCIRELDKQIHNLEKQLKRRNMPCFNMDDKKGTILR